MNLRLTIALLAIFSQFGCQKPSERPTVTDEAAAVRTAPETPDPIAQLRAGQEVAFHLVDENDRTPKIEFLKGSGESNAISGGQKKTRNEDIPRLYRQPPFNYSADQIAQLQRHFDVHDRKSDHIPMIFRGIVLQPSADRASVRILLAFPYREVPLASKPLSEVIEGNRLVLDIPNRPVNWYVFKAISWGQLELRYNANERAIEIPAATGGTKLSSLGFGERTYPMEIRNVRGFLATAENPLVRKPIDEEAFAQAATQK